jgi:hypothetical protein
VHYPRREPGVCWQAGGRFPGRACARKRIVHMPSKQVTVDANLAGLRHRRVTAGTVRNTARRHSLIAHAGRSQGPKPRSCPPRWTSPLGRRDRVCRMCRLFTAVNDVAQIGSFWPSCGCHHGRVGRPVAENPHRPGIHGRCASRVVRPRARAHAWSGCRPRQAGGRTRSTSPRRSRRCSRDECVLRLLVNIRAITSM